MNGRPDEGPGGSWTPWSASQRDIHDPVAKLRFIRASLGRQQAVDRWVQPRARGRPSARRLYRLAEPSEGLRHLLDRRCGAPPPAPPPARGLAASRALVAAAAVVVVARRGRRRAGARRGPKGRPAMAAPRRSPVRPPP